MGEFRDGYSPEPVNLNDAIRIALDEEGYVKREIHEGRDDDLSLIDENGNLVVKNQSGDPKPYYPDSGSSSE